MSRSRLPRLRHKSVAPFDDLSLVVPDAPRSSVCCVFAAHWITSGGEIESNDHEMTLGDLFEVFFRSDQGLPIATELLFQEVAPEVVGFLSTFGHFEGSFGTCHFLSSQAGFRICCLSLAEWAVALFCCLERLGPPGRPRFSGQIGRRRFDSCPKEALF